MTGAEHYRAAEVLLRRSEESLVEAAAAGGGKVLDAALEVATAAVGAAQVHATLALAAATAQRLADPYVGDGPHINEWRPTWVQTQAAPA